MAEVAFAAGFGSVRRFNETFRTLFGRPPSALRAARAAAPARACRRRRDAHGLRYRPPVRLGGDARATSRRAPSTGVEEVAGDALPRARSRSTAHRRTRRGRARAGAPRSPRRSAFAGACARLPAIVARVRRRLRPRTPTSTTDRRAPRRATRCSRRWSRRGPGLRVPGAWDGFELAVRAVLGQQVTRAGGAHARRPAGRALRRAAADGRAADAGLTHVFPTPERVAAPTSSRCGMPARARATLASLRSRRAVAEPALSTGGDRRRGGRAAARAARHRRWTAQYIALRALREPDAFPAADVGAAARRDAPPRRQRARRRRRCSRAPNAGGRGAPTPRSTCGRRPPRPSRGHMADRLFLERISTPVGELLLVTDTAGGCAPPTSLMHEDELRRRVQRSTGTTDLAPPPKPTAAAGAVAAYFAGDVRGIERLPVETGGTPFQRAVWAALRDIPCGTPSASCARCAGRPSTSHPIRTRRASTSAWARAGSARSTRPRRDARCRSWSSTSRPGGWRMPGSRPLARCSTPCCPRTP